MNYAKILPLITVFLTNSNDQHLGSGVLVTIGDVYYVLTASHVVHGHENSKYCTKDIEDIKIRVEKGFSISCIRELGNEKLHKEYDLTVLEVKLAEPIDCLQEVKFTSDHRDFPGFSYVFRGKALSVGNNAHTVQPCSLDTITDDKFVLSIPSEFYTSGTGEVGAEVLSGYSGSGVFITGVNGSFLVGLVLSVDDDYFMGVNCVCISHLSQFEIPKFTLSDVHGVDVLSENFANEIRSKVTKEMINDAKINQGKETDLVANLSKKMDVFSPGWSEQDLDGFVEDLLVWEDFYENNIKNEKSYVDLLNSAKDEFKRGNKNFRVKDEYEADKYFRKIEENFLQVLEVHLKGFPFLEKKSQTIVSGEISKLLGNCKINFRK
jgi:hypothetical protein